jgi:hypothetical protein
MEAIWMWANLFFYGVLTLLFLGMVATQIAGHHYARKNEMTGGAGSEGTVAVETALFALLGLLVAFTFSGADARLDARRKLIIEEANAVGTAYLRLDLLPREDVPLLKDEMRQYVDSRLSFYQQIGRLKAAKADQERGAALQQQIWNHAVTAGERMGKSPAALLVLQSLNQMFDIANSRYAALRMHMPFAVFLQLIIIALACGFFAGMGMGKRPRISALHVIMFSGIMAVTAYVILNLEFPRFGFGRLKLMDAFLIAQRAAMN